jgi:hypothetical protein
MARFWFFYMLDLKLTFHRVSSLILYLHLSLSRSFCFVHMISSFHTTIFFIVVLFLFFPKLKCRHIEKRAFYDHLQRIFFFIIFMSSFRRFYYSK